MKLQKIIPLLLAFIMLVPALCFSSCSQNEPTVTELERMLNDAGYVIHDDSYRNTDPAMEYRLRIQGGGEIILFKDVKSAKLYEKILENEVQEQINYLKYEIDRAKYMRKYSRDAGEWALYDQTITSYSLGIESHRDTKIERKGRIIYYGFPEFVGALTGTSSFDFWFKERTDMANFIDDIEYEIAKLFFEFAPEDSLRWKHSVAMHELNSVVIDKNEQGVTTAEFGVAEIAKFEMEHQKRNRKQSNELYRFEIDYYEYILSTFRDEMSEQAIASTEQQLAQAQQRLDNYDSFVYYRYDNMVIYGDPFYTVVTWLSHIPIIGSLFELRL